MGKPYSNSLVQQEKLTTAATAKGGVKLLGHEQSGKGCAHICMGDCRGELWSPEGTLAPLDL